MEPTGRPPVITGEQQTTSLNEESTAPEQSPENRRQLRKRSHPTTTEPPPVKKRKIVRPKDSLTWLPVRQAGQKLFINEQCLNNEDSLPDIDGLNAKGILDKHKPKVEKNSEFSVSGTGVFAEKNFQKGEIIGFYRGELIKRTNIPEPMIKLYCQQQGLDRYTLPIHMMAVWSEAEDGSIEFYSMTDSHVLWTGITVFNNEDTNIELGIDGLRNGNELAFLNHIRPSNVRPFPTLVKKSCVTGKNNLRHANERDFHSSDLWVPIVAVRNINKGEELGFDYMEQWKRSVKFSDKGWDVFSLAQRYVDINGTSVSFREKPRSDTSSDSDREDDSLSDELPLFANSLSLTEEELVTQLAEGDLEAVKKVTDQMRQNDEHSERAFQVYLFALGCQVEGITLQRYTELLRRCNYQLPGKKKGVSAVREYVRQHFHKTEAAKILNIAALDPDDLEKVKGHQTIMETYELLDQIEDDTPEARKALKAYCHNVFYRSNRKIYASAGKIYGNLKVVLKGRGTVLGRPGSSFDDEEIYKFMLAEGAFRNGDAARFMPMPYLRSMLTSTIPEEVEQGKNDLNAFAVQWRLDGKQPSALTALLQRDSIPNIFDEDTPWTLSSVLRIENPLQEPPKASLETERLVGLWLVEKSGSSHFDMHQLFLTRGHEVLKEVAFIMREKHKMPFLDIATKLVPFQVIDHDQLRNALYERGVELSKSNRDLSEILGSWVQVFYHRFRAAHAEKTDLTQEDLLKLDKTISKREWGELETELKNKRDKDDRNYMHFWTEMMKTCRTPELEKIFLKDIIQNYSFRKLVEKLNLKKIPVFSNNAKEWSRDELMKSAASHEIFDIRDSEHHHIAVLIAIAQPAGYMAEKTIEGQPFEAFLEKELSQKGRYNFRMEAELKKRHPDNPYFTKQQAAKRRHKKR